VILGAQLIVIRGKSSIFEQSCDDLDETRKWSEATEVAEAGKTELRRSFFR
jgi:hypothetical protein